MAKLSLDKAILKAKSLAKKGDIADAQKLYQAVLQAFPQNKRAQQGLASLNKPKQPNPTKSPPQETINQLINLYNQGQLGAVAEQAKALTLQYPDAFLVWNILGAANKGLGRVQAAADAFKKVTELNPTYADGFSNLGVTLKEQGKLEEAIEAYQKALSLKPDNAQVYNNMGNALKENGKLEEAIASYNKALSLKPDYADAFNNMGVAFEEQGKLDEAIACYNKAMSLKPDYAEASYNMGNALKEQSKLDEAIASYKKVLSLKPNYPEAYNNVGAALKDKGRLDEAIEAFKKALSLKPDYAEAYNNMGTALQEHGKLDEAIEAYQKALSLKPDDAQVYHNMGNALKENGKLEEAIASYNKALSLKPDYADAFNNMGVALKDQGKLDEAIASYSKVLSLKPDYAEASYNMGNALQEQSKLDEAIASYKKALLLKPDYADAFNNMGVALKDQGKLDEAIASYSKVLSLKPDHAEAYNNIGNALEGVTFKQPNPDLQKIIISLLDKKTIVRPSDIASAAISLLKFEPKLKRHLQSFSTAEVEPNLPEVIKDLCAVPLLFKLMSVCPLPDLELENLFRELRKSLLLNVADLKDSTEELEIQSALALHCFTNEYIYNQSEHEDKALATLEVSIKQSLSKGEQPSSQSILCLASYKPLNQFEWSSSLLITDEIQDVFIRQVAEPNQEGQFKMDIPVLEEITDEVSSKVKDQYEVSPYPRWVNLGLPLKPAPISKVVELTRLKLFDDKIKEVEVPNILIAGCGTGQHSIGTATRFKDSKVLAIDLSLSSLSYAKRKTEELGIQNINYMQGDILDLDKLNRQFDIVESSGVLHHMHDPVAGWRVLTDCLKPGGLMKIGLYSELARQHIVEMRKEISKSGIGSSDAEMKSFRAMVMTSDQSHHKKIVESSDFYSLSELKDLLFHVQEHRFTIPQIQDCLSKLGLKFCGFETDKIVSQFKLTRTSAGDPYELDRWRTYEEANPRAFFGMYQFWCQKVA